MFSKQELKISQFFHDPAPVVGKDRNCSGVLGNFSKSQLVTRPKSTGSLCFGTFLFIISSYKLRVGRI